MYPLLPASRGLGTQLGSSRRKSPAGHTGLCQRSIRRRPSFFPHDHLIRKRCRPGKLRAITLPRTGGYSSVGTGPGRFPSCREEFSFLNPRTNFAGRCSYKTRFLKYLNLLIPRCSYSETPACSTNGWSSETAPNHAAAVFSERFWK